MSYSYPYYPSYSSSYSYSSYYSSESYDPEEEYEKVKEDIRNKMEEFLPYSTKEIKLRSKLIGVILDETVNREDGEYRKYKKKITQEYNEVKEKAEQLRYELRQLRREKKRLWKTFN